MSAEKENLPWCVASDLSGTVNIGRGGGFATGLAATHRLIDYLEAEREGIAEKIATAKARRRVLSKRKPLATPTKDSPHGTD